MGTPALYGGQPVRRPKLLFAMGAPVGGDTLTNPTAKTAFATTYTLHANSLQVGDVLDIEFRVFFDFTAATNFTWELAIGATVLSVAMTGTCGADTNMLLRFVARVVSIGAAGSINIELQAISSLSGAAPFRGQAAPSHSLALAQDTTVANIISLSVTNSVSNASNTDQMYYFTVTHLPAS